MIGCRSRHQKLIIIIIIMCNVRDKHNIYFVIESLYVEIYRASKGFPVGAVQDSGNILTHCDRSYSALILVSRTSRIFSRMRMRGKFRTRMRIGGKIRLARETTQHCYLLRNLVISCLDLRRAHVTIGLQSNDDMR